jgi:PhnB protein
MHVNAYLSFNGQCEEAFQFYAKVCNGSIEAMLKYESAPPDMPITQESKNKIMHARVKLGDTIVMGSDAPPQFYKTPGGLSVCLSVETAAEAQRIFKAFSEGGSVHMAMEETFFAEQFGVCADRFGTPWMVICEKTMP